MLRTSFLAAVVLAVSTLLTTPAVAADIPATPSLTIKQLVARVVKVAAQKNWTISVDQVKRTIDDGVNFGTNGIIIPRGCDATDCERSFVVNKTDGKILDLPEASYEYLYEKGNPALIVNSNVAEYLRVNDYSNSGKLPDWLSRRVYVLRDGCLLLALEDKTGHDILPSEEIIAEYRSYESYDADFTPLAKPICK